VLRGLLLFGGARSADPDDADDLATTPSMKKA